MRVQILFLTLLLMASFSKSSMAGEIQAINAESAVEFGLSGSTLKVGAEKYSTLGRSIEAKDCLAKLQNFSRNSRNYLRVVIESSAGKLSRCTLHPK